MLYKGAGGLDAWINFILYASKADAQKVKSLLQDLRTGLRKAKRTKESDDLWFQLDNVLSEEEKYGWAMLIKASVGLQLHLKHALKK